MDTVEQFIQKAIIVHSNKYDYSKTNYINSRTKVIIICHIHGEFEQTPASHLFGQGCQKCWFNRNKFNTKQFIEKAIKIHGNKYDYSKVKYINAITKVIIICSEHGEFLQKPANHLFGQGCQKCSNELIGNRTRSNIDQFIQKAQQVHGNKYNYSKVEYINSQIKVTIICNKHGEFKQEPSSHLKGCGCPKCGINISIIKQTSNTKEFIEKAQQVHGNKYNYSKVEYTHSKEKIIIICPVHGEFVQTPNTHLKNSGCPRCSSSKGELTLEEIFKKHNIKYEPQYNIPEIVTNYEVDFYLPEYRLLVEFHGKQHYEYIPFFHDGNYSFDDQKRRDDMVRDAAIRWKYGYLEFNYKQFKYMSKEEFELMVINSINKRRI